MMQRIYVFKKKWKHILAGAFDAVGDVLFFWIERNKQIDSRALKKILVSRIDHLGDALLLRPVLFRLRQLFPDLQIHLLTPSDCAPVFSLDAFIDKVIPYRFHWYQKKASFVQQLTAFFKIISVLKKEKYDLAVDFRGDVRLNLLFALSQIPVRLGYGVTGGGWLLTHEKKWNDSIHQVLANARMLSDFDSEFTDNLFENPAIRFPSSAKAHLVTSFPDLFEGPYAMIHAGAGNPEKEWPWENFIELGRRLITLHKIKRVVFIGTVDEKKRCGEASETGFVDLRGQTDLHELACLMSGAVVFVGNDSGPAHLAAAQGIPLAVIASSTNKIENWHPWSSRVVTVSSSVNQPASVESVVEGIKNLALVRA